MAEKLPPGIVEMVAPGIGRKEDGGLVWLDRQGNVMMESDPNGWAKEVDEELPDHVSMLKTALDELTDEERRDLFTYYCHDCGTKDVPCRCWDDT